MATIIIVESGGALDALVGPALRQKGHEVIHASIEGLSQGQGAAELILLEVAGDLSRGETLLRELTRGTGANVIAVLPAEVADPPMARSQLLKAGAADCLSAPLHPTELEARIAACLAHTESVAKALSHSALDADTTVYSPWLFERRLVEEHMKASRYPMPLSFLLIALDDPDGLKTHHGAAFFRMVLRELALIVQHSLRTSDFVARCAPTEFGVLMPFTNPTDAVICAERIRGRAEVFPFRHESVSANATVSVGVAGYSPKRTPDPPTLVQEARICLDFARKNGGNQVVADESYLPGMVQDSSYETLIDQLRSGDEFLQMKAYHALRQAREGATFALARALQDPAPHVRRYCAWALGAMAAKGAGPDIALLLKDQDSNVRAVAAWALGRIADPNTAPSLIEAIADEDVQVRAAAALSLSMLSGDALRPKVTGTPQELRAEVESCLRRWQERGKKG